MNKQTASVSVLVAALLSLHTSSVALFAQTATPAPGEAAKPTTAPAAPSLAYPEPKQPVTPQNAAQVRQLVRWGKGLAEGLAYSPDGRRLAVASGLGVYLYDAESLAETRFISTEVIAMRVAFSPDGQVLAHGSLSGLITLRDAQTGRQLRQMDGHSGAVFELSFSPDGKVISLCIERQKRQALGRADRPGDSDVE